ncbi:MAG: hypothetical protein OEY23_21935 [Acidimicrobiia bacterium]|nr:hypothetical protein [Acidimicrobiia bacterium]
MCRVDEDWDWLVESENVAVAIEPTTCEDCGRSIDAGEAYWDLVEVPAQVSDADLVLIATSPAVGAQPHYQIIRPIGPDDAADEAWWDAMEALGFIMDEDYDPRSEPEPGHRTWCAHCREANAWLEKVCHQHTYLVAAQDIIEHSYDYTAEQLGEDFVALAGLVKARWRPDGQLADLDVVKAHTAAAIKHALAGGLIS